MLGFIFLAIFVPYLLYCFCFSEVIIDTRTATSDVGWVTQQGSEVRNVISMNVWAMVSNRAFGFLIRSKAVRSGPLLHV